MNRAHCTPSYLAVQIQKILKKRRPDFKLGEAQELVANLTGFPSWNEMVAERPARHLSRDNALLKCEDIVQLRSSVDAPLTIGELCNHYVNAASFTARVTAQLNLLGSEIGAAVATSGVLKNYSREPALDFIGYSDNFSPQLQLAYVSEEVGTERLVIRLGLGPYFWVGITRSPSRPHGQSKDVCAGRISTERLFPSKVRCELSESLDEVLKRAVDIADREISRMRQERSDPIP